MVATEGEGAVTSAVAATWVVEVADISVVAAEAVTSAVVVTLAADKSAAVTSAEHLPVGSVWVAAARAFLTEVAERFNVRLQ